MIALESMQRGLTCLFHGMEGRDLMGCVSFVGGTEWAAFVFIGAEKADGRLDRARGV